MLRVPVHLDRNHLLDPDRMHSMVSFPHIVAIAFDDLGLDLLWRLLVAAVLGGAIGMEREMRGKAAGFRTNMLICIGAALIAEISIGISLLGDGPVSDPGRIAAQAISAVGFIGAGVILQARGHVTGITTAATIWVVVAIGLAVGAEMYTAAVGTTLFVLATLIVLGRMEWRLRERPHRHSVRIEMRADAGGVAHLRSVLEGYGFEPVFSRAEERDGRLSASFRVVAGEKEFRRALEALISRPEITAVSR
jgi:putative Mg2+ transporter-C (MgtC) family protein